jgi:hypothetical protein
LVDRSDKEIARRLAISAATVKNHMQKLQVTRRGEAAARLRAPDAADPIINRLSGPERKLFALTVMAPALLATTGLEPRLPMPRPIAMANAGWNEDEIFEAGVSRAAISATVVPFDHWRGRPAHTDIEEDFAGWPTMPSQTSRPPDLQDGEGARA